MDPVIVTGAAGFIGYHVAERLLAQGEQVIGVDDFNPYYSPKLKAARVMRLEQHPDFRMIRLDIANASDFERLVLESGCSRLIHLAAQAGVRYSLENPFLYERSNLAGHLSVLEACRRATNFSHLVYASSSSVYGNRPRSGSAFREDDPADSPVSLYAATKRACEMMSYSYSKLYSIPQSGLRFFTVYGPWGRPDMAYFSFTRKIIAGEPIEIYGGGDMRRDFTYIDDIVDGIMGVFSRPPSSGEHRIFNIGDDCPEELMDMVAILEGAIGKQAKKTMLPMQPGDVNATWADISQLKTLSGYAPKVRLAEGLDRFVRWYRHYHEG